jgi:hypothetical protein
MKKELFVCDSCSTRKRLNSAERHWCDACNRGAPVEMRHVRDKKPEVSDTIAALISPVPPTSPTERNSRGSPLTFGAAQPAIVENSNSGTETASAR